MSNQGPDPEDLTQTDRDNLCVICLKLPDDAVGEPCLCHLHEPGAVSDTHSTLDQLRVHIDNLGVRGHPICVCGEEVSRGRLYYRCENCAELWDKKTGINIEIVDEHRYSATLSGGSQ